MSNAIKSYSLSARIAAANGLAPAQLFQSWAEGVVLKYNLKGTPAHKCIGNLVNRMNEQHTPLSLHAAENIFLGAADLANIK